MKHANGQSGAHHMAETSPPVWQPQPSSAAVPAAPAGGGFINLTKGYLPILAVIPVVGMVGYAGWFGGMWWQKQLSTIEEVQKDVTTLKQDVTVVKQSQAKIEASQSRQEDLLKKMADNPPWYVSVKQAAR